MFPARVHGLVLVASTGPDCLSTRGHVLAAPVIGPAGAITTFAIARWAPRVILTAIERRLDRPLRPDEHVEQCRRADTTGCGPASG